MKGLKDMWKSERHARWFFLAHLQGALGAGAGYIALLVLAYDRIGSAWGATAVLLADLLPAMLLGPLLGAAIDRTSRLGGAILADVIRASAFGALVFADGIVAMIGFALLAGFGTALFRPATYALMPGLVAPARLNVANGLFNAVRDTGQLLGPVLAAGAARARFAGGRAGRERDHVRAVGAAALPAAGPRAQRGHARRRRTPRRTCAACCATGSCGR